MLTLSNIYKYSRPINIKKDKIFDVILNVSKYNEFLPNCKESKIILNTGNNNFNYKITYGNSLLEHYNINNVIIDKNEISSSLISSSLFNKFNCKWKIIENDNTNILNFSLDYTLKNEYYIYSYLLNDNVINMQLDFFEKRFYS